MSGGTLCVLFRLCFATSVHFCTLLCLKANQNTIGCYSTYFCTFRLSYFPLSCNIKTRRHFCIWRYYGFLRKLQNAHVCLLSTFGDKVCRTKEAQLNQNSTVRSKSSLSFSCSTKWQFRFPRRPYSICALPTTIGSRIWDVGSPVS